MGPRLQRFLTASLLTAAAFGFILGCDSEAYPYYLRHDHGILWVANAADNTVTCINRYSDREIGTYSVGPSPSRTAVDLSGNCWVGCRSDDSVWYVTIEGEKEEYNGFNAARGVALDRNGDLWVANSGNQTIQWIETESGTVSEQVIVPGANYLYGAVIDGENTLWLSDSSQGNVIRYPISSFPSESAFETIDVTSIYGITLDLDGNVWAAGQDGWIRRIDPNTHEIEEWPSEASFLSGATVDINNRLWFCADSLNALIRFDQESEDSLLVPIGASPHGVAADDAGFVYAVNRTDDSVTKVDARNGDVVHEFSVGNDPYTYSDLTGFIYRKVTLGL